METIVEICNNHARTRPEKTALIMLDERGEEAERLSYSTLDEKARCIAARLQLRYEVGNRALMLFRPGLEFIVAFLACQYAGMVPVPVSLSSRKPHHLRRIEHISMDAGIALVITASDWQADIHEWLKDSPLGDLECLVPHCAKPGPEWVVPTLAADDLAFLQYTSGSTGNPKGVMVTHANLIHNEQVIKYKYQHDADVVVGGWLPFYHDMGLIGLILQTIYLGASLVLMAPVSFVKRPANWLRAINRYRISSSGGPNFGFEHCVARIRDEEIEGIDLSCWRICFNGAEPVKYSSMRAFADRFSKYGFRYESFYPCYGLAEATLFVSGGTPGVAARQMCINRDELELNRVVPVVEGHPLAYTVVSSGRPHDLEVAIVDPSTDSRLGERQVGEVWVHGCSVASGYWQDPDKTNDTFRASVAGELGTHYMRTGDLGFLDGSELYITGRIKDLVIINGRNIYPQDIEYLTSRINSRFAAGLSAAFAVDGGTSEAVVIVQEVNTRGGVERETLVSLSEAVRREVANNFDVTVASVVLTSLGTIPRTTSGKIQRGKTKALWAKAALEPLYESRLAGGQAHSWQSLELSTEQRRRRRKPPVSA
ncbi:fatty acyl-AMP ligase [Acidiferrobacter thiooxydans]|uniref:Uncharacterized protein n=1 Tax=Acidiferrobacter thiooxydans TaxID=163359 RepID=A0A368HCV6_9GAMM|nr:fatty acyl-AMP ligase [Acidiferrobacter thiooxydans]RCN56198.1 hypothetical protein C4900_10100 [Acidiferrobacter thiooxydans]